MEDTPIAIVGPAGGRGLQYPASTFSKMVKYAEKFIIEQGRRHVYSGGSALSDHVAVRLFLEDKIDKLTLYLPDEWDSSNKQFQGSREGIILNNLHRKFSQQCQLDSLAEIDKAIKKGAEIKIIKGFKRRNNEIAKAEILLAFSTVGSYPSTNGTLDTWNKHRGYKIAVNMLAL